MDYIKTISYLLMLGFMLADILVGQNKVDRPSNMEKKGVVEKNIRIDKRLPTVYLTAEKVLTSLNESSKLDRSRIRFRLKNNTRWDLVIWFSQESDSTDDVLLSWDLLDKDGNLLSENGCHVCSIASISPGGSVGFSIPVARLANGNSIRVSYSYDWEEKGRAANYGGIEPSHYAIFHLPELEYFRAESKVRTIP